jgi:hypothetical protein
MGCLGRFGIFRRGVDGLREDLVWGVFSFMILSGDLDQRRLGRVV